jgi:hypothetical protein
MCILIITSKFIKGEIQNDETFAAAAATENHFEILSVQRSQIKAG